MEAAPNLVIHSAISHLVERERGHLERVSVLRPVVIAEEEIDAHAGWEFRSIAEAALARIEAAAERARRLGQDFGAECSGSFSALHALVQMLPQHLCIALHFVAACSIGLGDVHE